MARLLVHVEGQTEETFVEELLRPHLLAHGFTSVSAKLKGADSAHAEDKLTSSKIGQKLGLKTAQFLDRATEQGFLLFDGEKHTVTPKGEQAGVEFVAKSRFGPYFLWPQDFCLG